MANLEQAKILRRGVKIWNQWRKKHPNVRPELSGADLPHDLNGADLRNADLKEADLLAAKLSNADLSMADLRGADLSQGVDLQGAKLQWTDLRKANLEGINAKGANFSGADASEANFNYAELRDADLSGTSFFGAWLLKTNLRNSFIGKGVKWSDLHQTDLIWGANEFSSFRADLDAPVLDDYLGEEKQEYIPACFWNANLNSADLRGANISYVSFMGADFQEADLRNTNLMGSDLSWANLADANLSGVPLISVDLSYANLNRAILEDAEMRNCRVFGISAWEVKLKKTRLANLIITPYSEPTVTVADLEMAQFIYLLMKKEKVRDVINTITSKVVLILGRFTPKRKVILEAIRDCLPQHDLVPIIFDFERPASQDFIETVSTLAHMAKFVIADFTDPKIILDEVSHIVRNIAVPVKPILEAHKDVEPISLRNLRINHRSVLRTFFYRNLPHLITNLREKVIVPAETKARELERRRLAQLKSKPN